MSISIQSLKAELAYAANLLDQGKLDTAESLLIQLVNRWGKNPDVHNLLGVIYANKGAHKLAQNAFKKSIGLYPNNPQFILNLVRSQMQTSDFGFAEKSLIKVISLSPSNPEALSLMADIKMLGQNFNAAIELLIELINLFPNNSIAYYNLGRCYAQLGENDAALDAYNQCLINHPNLLPALSNKAVLLNSMGKVEEAITVFKYALSQSPNNVDLLTNLASALSDIGDYKEAVLVIDRAIEIDNNNSSAWTNRAVLQWFSSDYDEAEASFLTAMSIEGSNLAFLKKSLSQLYLEKMDFEQGWSYYEYRHSANRYGKVNQETIFSSIKAWDGKPREGKLLIWSEQGLGDQILYSTMLNNLISLPQEIFVAVDIRLHACLLRSMPHLKFVDIQEIVDISEFNEQISLPNLGRFFRKNLLDFNNVIYPYLMPDQSRSSQLRKKIVGSKSSVRVIGIAWHSKNLEIGKDKSLILSDLRSLFQDEENIIVNLQYGDTTKQQQDLFSQYGHKLLNVPEVDNFNDIDGLISLINSCDLVVSISNTTAHLAGAIGKRTLLLLPPKRGRIWYWHAINGNSLWYPSIKVIKPENDGTLKSCVDEVIRLI